MSSFPKYVFGDQDELSYILYTFLKDHGYKKGFKKEELLFLQLLILICKDNLSLKMLQMICHDVPNTLAKMGNIKKEIQ